MIVFFSILIYSLELSFFLLAPYFCIKLLTMDKLKKRWGITSNWQLTAIIIVFAINGTFAAWVAEPVTEFFGFSSETTSPYLLYLFLRIILVFPIYQITLPIVGAIFGQFKFFWNFEKKMFKHMGLGIFVN